MAVYWPTQLRPGPLLARKLLFDPEHFQVISATLTFAERRVNETNL
jgi:hypothetical protein